MLPILACVILVALVLWLLLILHIGLAENKDTLKVLDIAAHSKTCCNIYVDKINGSDDNSGFNVDESLKTMKRALRVYNIINTYTQFHPEVYFTKHTSSVICKVDITPEWGGVVDGWDNEGDE